MKPLFIAVDFDGTVVTHEYPAIGKDVGAVSVLKRLVKAGHNLILYTMRHDAPLEHAIYWFSSQGIPLAGVNTNPTQSSWTGSPKAFAHIYIDDAALGCPLLQLLNGEVTKRPFVDWKEVERSLISRGVLE